MERHGTTTQYRYGCRCLPCRRVHSEDTVSWRRSRIYGPDGPMSPTVRARIVAAVRHGATIPEAAAAVGVSHQQVVAATRVLPEFAAEMERAERGAGRRRGTSA